MAGKRRGLAAVAVLACATGAGLGGVGASASSDAPTMAAALKAANAPQGELKQAGRSIHVRGMSITRYKQTVGGIPVLNGEVAVFNGGDSGATLATDSSAAHIAAPPAAKVSAARAISIARAATGASGLRAKPRAPLAIDAKHGGRLVRHVLLGSSKPIADFDVLVDALSGKVLSKRNVLHYGTASAKLYNPNPVAVNAGYSGLGTGPGADHNDHDTSKLTSLRNQVNFKVKSGQHCLLGAYVESRLGKPNPALDNGKPVCKGSLNWNSVTRASNTFEALEAYQQIDQIQGYYHTLGFTGPSSVHPKRQTVVVDDFPDDNSFYSSSDRKIRFGVGGVDDAEDGDVITHEYGHSIQDAQDPGFGSSNQAGALGEGFGDFESTVNTLLSPDVPSSYLEAAAYCIFDWDGTGGYGGPGVKPCGRLATGTDGTNTYSQALSTCNFGPDPPEVHCLGEVWSHGLIDLLGNSSVGQAIVVDVLASQFAYADNESFTQAVNGLVAVDNGVFAGSHVAAICAEMKGLRGINASSCP